MSILAVDVPRALQPLLGPSRYKGAYGGRGGAKSHFFAEQVVLEAFAHGKRIVCIREVQNTIRDSVKELVVRKIAKLGLEAEFVVLDNEVRHKRNGGLIIFKGMQSYNAENIKSLEGFDIAWVEEAQTLSSHSLKMLRPTIRKEGSEIWFSWNPRHETDPVDKFFRDGNKRTGSIAVNVNWYDNPWFPEVLLQEKDDDFAADPETAEHVWGGGYEIITEAAYYAKLVSAAEKEGRVGRFPYVPGVPVHTSWDIGVDDYTVIWFWQVIAGAPRVIDFYEINNAGAEEIVQLAMPEYHEDLAAGVANLMELGRDKPFMYGTHYFPHDIKVREWGAGAKQRSLTMMELGVKPIHVGVQTDPADRINASRRLLPLVHFNDTPRVRLGLSHLRRFSRKKNELLGTYTGVLHDEHSHAADGFGEFAVNCGLQPKMVEPPKKPQPPLGTVALHGAPKPQTTTRIRL